jgi:hypothetical protein
MKTIIENTKVGENIEIEGVVLTPQLIHYIGDMQDNNNEQVESQREFIADVICMISGTLNDLHGEDKDYAAEILCGLSHMRVRFTNLMKP